MALVNPGIRPMIEGPKRMPPMTSAMTLGWRSFDRGQWSSRQKIRMMPAWMMKRMMGFLLSYLVGFSPSRMPPWEGALSVLVAEAEVNVVVTTFVAVTVMVAMLIQG